MTGQLNLKVATSDRSDLGSISGSNALDLSGHNAFTATITGATTITISNVPTGTRLNWIVFQITNAGTNITWPGSVTWPDGGTAPTFTASGVDVVTMLTFDAGTTWRAVASVDFS